MEKQQTLYIGQDL